MDFVILSIVMLSIGIYGLLTNRNLIKVFISLELIAIAATLNFIMFALGQPLGEALMIIAFATDTAVSAVILAVLVILSRKYGISDISKIPQLILNKQDEKEVEE